MSKTDEPQHVDLRAQLTLPRRTPEDATPDVAKVLEETQRKLGRIPNMYAAMANSPGLFATYRDGYDRFRTASGFSPVEQEVIFLTISRENGCDYCVAAHSTIADTASQVPHDVTNAIRDGAAIADPKLAALRRFTQAMLQTQGRPRATDLAGFLAAGYEERQVLEVILAIAVKTLSNYTNHVFATPLDAAFAKRAWVSGAPS